MGNEGMVIFVVDDDDSVRRSLARLFKSVGMKVETFASAGEFLNRGIFDGLCCLVADVRMPGLSGLELQEELAKSGCSLPIVFITGHGDIPMSVRAMKKGAVDFLTKPINDQDLLEAINRAVSRGARVKRDKDEVSRIRERVDSLTPREREVFELVTAGMLNKQVAYEMRISEKTVKVHRARVMEKMDAESLADLVRMAYKVGIGSAEK